MITSSLDFNGLGQLVTSIAILAGVLAGIYQNRKIVGKVDDVHDAVNTMNETPLGELGAANETRRILGIPHDERNPTEQRHLDTSPPPEPEQGPPR